MVSLHCKTLSLHHLGYSKTWFIPGTWRATNGIFSHAQFVAHLKQTSKQAINKATVELQVSGCGQQGLKNSGRRSNMLSVPLRRNQIRTREPERPFRAKWAFTVIWRCDKAKTRAGPRLNLLTNRWIGSSTYLIKMRQWRLCLFTPQGPEKNQPKPFWKSTDYSLCERPQSGINFIRGYQLKICSKFHTVRNHTMSSDELCHTRCTDIFLHTAILQMIHT